MALDDIITTLRNERTRLDARIAAIDTAIDALLALELGDDLTPAKPANPPPKVKPPVMAETTQAHRCLVEGCGKVFAGAHALSVHHARTRGPNAGKSTKPKMTERVTVATKAEPAPAKPATPIHGKVLACTECEFTCSIDRMHDLIQHSLGTHKRRPTLEEKQPVAA